jgi:hypothetical protein
MRKPDNNVSDAEALAARIEHFWVSRGFAGIVARVKARAGTGKVEGGFDIRTNLMPNGFPPPHPNDSWRDLRDRSADAPLTQGEGR